MEWPSRGKNRAAAGLRSPVPARPKVDMERLQVFTSPLQVFTGLLMLLQDEPAETKRLDFGPA
jgi:hypothetical protein